MRSFTWFVLVIIALLPAGCSKKASPTAPIASATPQRLNIAPDTLTIWNTSLVGTFSISTPSDIGESWRVVAKPSWATIAPDSGVATPTWHTITVTTDTTGLVYGDHWGAVVIQSVSDTVTLAVKLVNKAPVPKLYGIITSDRTLTAALPGPDYFAIGDLTVAPGATLTVEPGVTLILDSGSDFLASGRYVSATELIVQGRLMIGANALIGNSEVRVEAGGALAAEQMTSVGAIVRVLGHADVQNCTFRGLIGGVSSRLVIDGGTATVVYCQFREAGVIQNTGALSISDCDFSGSNALGTFGGTIMASRLNVVTRDNGLEFWGTSGTLQECNLVGDGRGTGITLCAGISTTAPDTLNVRPTTVRNFGTGVRLSAGATARNLVVTGMIGYAGYGILGSGTNTSVNYCTVAGNGGQGIWMPDDSCTVLNSISAENRYGGVLLTGQASWADFSDSWGNDGNWLVPPRVLGPHVSSYDPSFVGTADYHLSSGSMYLNFSVSGGQIGAYGPGQ
jgi:hypothetical protein